MLQMNMIEQVSQPACSYTIMVTLKKICVSIFYRIDSTRDMCNLLKDHTLVVEDRLQLCKCKTSFIF